MSALLTRPLLHAFFSYYCFWRDAYFDALLAAISATPRISSFHTDGDVVTRWRSALRGHNKYHAPNDGKFDSRVMFILLH